MASCALRKGRLVQPMDKRHFRHGRILSPFNAEAIGFSSAAIGRTASAF